MVATLAAPVGHAGTVRAGPAAATGRTRDPSREGFSRAKLRAMARLLLPQNTRTLARVDRIEALDLARIQNGTGTRLGGLIVDVDETVAPHHGRIRLSAIEKLAAWVHAGIPVVIYSNASGDTHPDRAADLDTLEKRGVVVMRGQIPAKPEPAGFEAARAALGNGTLRKGQVAMVGDNYLTDGGAIHAGFHFVKVAPVPTDERQFQGRAWLNRLVQRALRATFDGVSRLHDLGRESPLRLADDRPR